MQSYVDLLAAKQIRFKPHGIFADVDLSGAMFPHQDIVTRFLLRAGCGAAFLDTGLGKSFIALEWGRIVSSHAGKPVLMLAPLAVGPQHAREAQKFGIDAAYMREPGHGSLPPVVISNYERLHLWDPSAFSGIILDESSILKSFQGRTKSALIDAFGSTPYRLACTATPAPNDHMELGNHSEFLGIMRSNEMLSRWFVNDTSTASQKWRLKGHAEGNFWDWVSSWARCVAKPSDIGCADDGFDLPELKEFNHVVTADRTIDRGEDMDGQLRMFRIPELSATSVHREKRMTIGARAAVIADVVNSDNGEPWIVWCDTDAEADAIRVLIPDAVEVRGSMKADVKEDRLTAFSEGRERVIVTKASIAGFGLNWQHCARMAFVGLNFCFDEDTEILTRRGWRSFCEVTIDDDVAAIDPADLQMKWEKPTHVTWEAYEGEMVKFGGQRSFDLLVTPNHRMLVKRCDVRYGRDCGEWHFREAGDLAANWKRQEYRLPSIPRKWEGERLDITPIPIPEGYRRSSRSRVVGELDARQVAMLAGWYLSEGHVRPNRNIFIISQSDVNHEHRAEIIDLLQSLGLNVGSKTKDIYACSQNLSIWLADQFGVGSYEKRIPSWLKNADSETLNILRDTMIKGDGCHSQGRICAYRSYSRQLQDDFQEICLKTGMKASVKPNWGGVMLGHEYFEPSISIRPTLEPYEGMIGCVSVPSGAILVRRNGIPIITGNSYESYYQAVRRCWRFGQKRPVHVHTAMADTEKAIFDTITRKADDHAAMKAAMTDAMRRATQTAHQRPYDASNSMTLPSWLH